MADLKLAAQLLLNASNYVEGAKQGIKSTEELEKTLEQLDKAARQAEDGLDESTKGSKKLEGAQEDLQKEVKQSEKELDKFGKTNSRTAADVGKSIGKYTALGAALATAVAANFIDAARTAENYQVRLNVLLGSQAEGNRLFQEMADYASQVPFQFESIMESATQLAGVMDGGVEQIKEWMPIIGDLAAASGLTIEQSTEQVVRMFSAGAGAADLFREKGITAMLGFQAGVSYSAEETRAMLIKAYEDPASKFRGAALDMANTWDGVMSMMGDKWFLFRNMIMDEGVFEYFKELARILNEEMGESLEESEGKAAKWAEVIITGIGEVILSGAQLMDFFGSLSGVMNLASNGAQELYIKYLQLQSVQLEFARIKNIFNRDMVAVIDAELADVDARIEATRGRIEVNNQQAYESFNKDWTAIAETVIARAEQAAEAARKANEEIVDSSNETKDAVINNSNDAWEAIDDDLDKEAAAWQKAYDDQVKAADRKVQSILKGVQTEREEIEAWYRDSVASLRRG